MSLLFPSRRAKMDFEATKSVAQQQALVALETH